MTVVTANKNLNNGINYGFYITEPATNYKASDGNNGLCIALPEGTYTISTNTIQTRYRAACSNTLPSSTAQDCYNGVNKDGTSNNITINTSGYKYLLINATELTNIQIEKGSTATTYEPYKGKSQLLSLGSMELCKIGDYQDSIRRSTGKNLFDKVTATVNQEKYTLNADGTITNTSNYGSDGRNYFNPIMLESGTYTISFIANLSGASNQERFSVKNDDTTEDIINSQVYITNGIKQEHTFTINSPTNIKFSIQANSDNAGTITLRNIQLEKGSTATGFEPFGITWYKHKEIGKAIFNGSESWADRPNYDSADRFVLDFAVDENKYAAGKLSNYFQIETLSSTTYPYIYFSGTQVGVNFSEKGTTTLSDFKAWLSTHNTIAYYVLTTPVNEEITDTTLLEQLNNLIDIANGLETYKNVTNIYTETSNLNPQLEISYLVDDRVAINNTLSSLEARVTLLEG